jgi:hypothetical protein
MSQVFNSSVIVSEQFNRMLISTAQDLACRAVMECAERYKFDGKTAILELGLNSVSVQKVTKLNKENKENKEKKTKIVADKPKIPMPFNGEFNEACCFALRQNNGLYTQCQVIRKEGEEKFCKTCQSKASDDIPEYGTIQERLAVGIFEFQDSKQRKPTPFTKIMKKYKMTQAEVEEEALKFNIIINPDHFIAPVEVVKRGRPASTKEKSTVVKGVKGRPKKDKKVLHIDGEDDADLFASLVANATKSDEEDDVVIPVAENEADKEAKKLAEKAEKEAKLAADRAAKLAEKEAKKLAEKAEKEAKKLAEKAEKEANLAAEKATKLAEKEAKKEANKSEKKNNKKQAEDKKEEADEADVCKKITFNDKKYLKSKKTGIVYDLDIFLKTQEQVVIGQWNEATNAIDFKKADDEEEEEEYDEESDEEEEDDEEEEEEEEKNEE